MPRRSAIAQQRTQSVSGNSFFGSTSHWPVPPGDSPGGTGSALGTNKDRPFGSGRPALPFGGAPNGTGGSPVLPNFRTRSQSASTELVAGRTRIVSGNGSFEVNRF